jgi:hypothetical protein
LINFSLKNQYRQKNKGNDKILTDLYIGNWCGVQLWCLHHLKRDTFELPRTCILSGNQPLRLMQAHFTQNYLIGSFHIYPLGKLFPALVYVSPFFVY